MNPGSPTVLVTGIFGQDGAYLAQQAVADGWRVIGGARRIDDRARHWRLERLGLQGRIDLVDMDLADDASIRAALGRHRPDAVVNLAAQSSVQRSFDDPLHTADVTAMGAVRLMLAVRDLAPAARFVQASSAEVLAQGPQADGAPPCFRPRNPYGAAKAHAHAMALILRDAGTLDACVAVLFNHESPLREATFVSRKITRGLVQLAQGEREVLPMGNLDAARDWLHARDAARALWLMVRRPTCGDYTIGSGTARSVRDFVDTAAARLGLPIRWQGSGAQSVGVHAHTGRPLITVDPALLRPGDAPQVATGLDRTLRELGWRPETSFEDMVFEMVDAERNPTDARSPP